MLRAMNDEHCPGGDLLDLLASAAHLADARRETLARERGISVLAWQALSVLARTGPICVGSLARRCGMKQPTLTRVLDRLARSGHVERLRGERDRRLRLVSISQTGRSLVGDLSAGIEVWRRNAFDRFGGERRRLLEELLRELMGCWLTSSPSGDTRLQSFSTADTDQARTPAGSG